MAGSALTYLENSRRKTLDRSPSAGAFTNIFYSGTTYALWRSAKDLTAEHSKGLVLDAGSGRGAWREVIEAKGATRESVDIAPKAGEQVTWVADLCQMPQVPSDRFDAIVCHQVLEHVPSPSAAIAELFRAMKPGGTMVISVPHLSRLHELPHDYFRFTPSGLGQLLTGAGFELASMRPYGGIATFLHHQASTLLLQSSAIFYPLYLFCLAVNAPLSLLSAAFDRLVDRNGLLANGFIAVARKPLEAASP